MILIGLAAAPFAAGADRPPETVRVEAPTSLWQLLRDRGRLPAGGPTREYLEAFRLLNPTVRDIGVLPAGTSVRLPQPPASSGTVRPYPFRQTGAQAAGRPGVARTPEPELTFRIRGSPAPEALGAAQAVFGALGESIESRGTLEVPIRGGARVRVDLRTVPLVRIGKQRKLLLDGRGVLDRALVALLEESGQGYRIIGPEKSGDLTAFIGEALGQAGYYAVRRDAEVQVTGSSRLMIHGDWLVLKTGESLLNGGITLLSLVRNSEEWVPPLLARYARRHGVEVEQIPVGAAPTPRGQTRVRRGEVVILDRSRPEALIDGLLRALGIPFESDVRVVVDRPTGTGVQVEIQAARVIRQGGVTYILDFGRLPEDLRPVLEGSGYEIVRLPKGPEAAIGSLVQGLRLTSDGEGGTFWKSLDRGGGPIRLRVPGLVVFPSGRGDRSPVLVTGAALEPEIEDYLLGKGIVVVRF